jgi:hypothetical protein
MSSTGVRLSGRGGKREVEETTRKEEKKGDSKQREGRQKGYLRRVEGGLVDPGPWTSPLIWLFRINE